MPEEHETEHAEDLHRLRYVVLALTGTLLMGFVCLVVLYGQYGRAILDHLESVEPVTVFREGMLAERAGKLDEAIADYQKALDLGLKWPPSRNDCKERLRRLLEQREKAGNAAKGGRP